jgi:hypothetical protein
LRSLLDSEKDVRRKLRVLWALYSVNGIDEKGLVARLDSPEELVRVWAIRLLLDDSKASDALVQKLAVMAKDDKSAAVRLALASALQRLPVNQRWPIAEALAAHATDAQDANLPLMIWYGIEPLVEADPQRAAALLAKTRIPLVRQYIARRLAVGAD